MGGGKIAFIGPWYSSDESTDSKSKRSERERKAVTSAAKNGSKASTMGISYDTDLYEQNGVDKYAGYNTSIAVTDGNDAEMNDGDVSGEADGHRLVGQYTATRAQMDEFAHGGAAEDDILMSREQQAQIASRENDYQKRRYNRGPLSPTRADPFAASNEDGAQQQGKTYRDIMQERELEREEERVKRLIEEKQAKGEDGAIEHKATLKPQNDQENHEGASADVAAGKKRKKRWDASTEDVKDAEKPAQTKRSRWEETPAPAGEAQPAPRRSRWDEIGPTVPAAPAVGPVGATPAPAVVAFGTNYARGNGPISDEALDGMLPGPPLYKVLAPPPGYEPTRVPIASATAAPIDPTASGGFMMQDPVDAATIAKDLPSQIPGVGDLQFFKESDNQYFKKLAEPVDENELSVDELKQRKIMRLLLKVKNGTPPMRKTALRTLTDNARAFGAAPLFDQILPLLMEKTLEDQERHLLVKVIDRILYKLGELVRPHTHKILIVIEPLLIDQDHYARLEGKEIISNLAKAAGLASMISVMRPDVDASDEYVRNTTARAFAIVGVALGIPSLLPFVKAVCRSKKAWEARHTGIKIVQNIAIFSGCAILPHLKGLVDCISDNLKDEQAKVKTAAAMAISSLAQASKPYGIESFGEILSPLWSNARQARGKNLASFLQAIGNIIPLMDEEHACQYADNIMDTLLNNFDAPDDELRRTVLQVVSQCATTAGITPKYLHDKVLKRFFKSFWVRRMAIDKRTYRQVVQTTVDIGQKVGSGVILERIVVNLKDENEAYRKMTAETVEKAVSSLGVADVDSRLEERLVDGILHAFQEQSTEDPVLLNAFGTFVNALGPRTKPYLPQIVSTILYRLEHKATGVRQQAADLISRIAVVMKQCGDDALMNKLSVALYENLGEEYPEVLGSILGALRAIVSVIGISQMQPSVRDLLPRLTPIMKNRHEKVQENTIDLVGRIADRGPESVNAREWMRICFELLDMLKAHRKGIRRAANNTFGYIAKAVGPSDVLTTLLNNLRVQERQSRVCTAVAIGIVAETCAPFTVLPALMNEYRVPELNVQNGVIKAMSFLFEYIGEMAKDYVYAVTPLLEDALTDRDQVHRQTAASVVKHIALGVMGLGCEDALLHLLNLLMPNIFETSPHVIDRIIEAIDAIRNAVGTGVVMNYVFAGLFHPARKVRTPYWRLYNEAYVQSADSMVPYYPDFDNEKLPRHELYIIL